MPIYETVLQEKPPVVLEIGNAYTKVGFAAEASPRFILPSRISREGETRNLLDIETEQALYDNFVEFLGDVFFKYLLVSPKERKVVIVESVFCPTNIRETLAKVLFRHFEVSSLFFAPLHLVTLATLGIETALVVDIGFKETTVMPVYSGIQVIKAFQAQPYGGQAIEFGIRKWLEESGVNKKVITDETVEDIKVRTCFVTKSERSKRLKEGDSAMSCPSVEYLAYGIEVIQIPGSLRETAMDVLFPDDNEHSGLPNMILDAILACPVDIRKDLATNIVVIGGTAETMGLKSRLKSEMHALLKTDVYQNSLFIKEIKFHPTTGRKNYCAWLGGAIYGGTELVLSKSFSKDVYFKNGKVPDWIDL